MNTNSDDYEEELTEAANVLQPFWDEGDDGDAVCIALDSIGGILCEKAGVDAEAEDALLEILRSLKAPKDLRTGVKKLYASARRGSYGEGLSKKDARSINDVVQDLVDPLLEFVREFDGRRTTRPKSPTRKGRRQ